MSLLNKFGAWIGIMTIFLSWTSQHFADLSTGTINTFFSFIAKYEYHFMILGLFIIIYNKWIQHKFIFYLMFACLIALQIYTWWK